MGEKAAKYRSGKVVLRANEAKLRHRAGAKRAEERTRRRSGVATTADRIRW